jgi:heme-degrading monooxygenase HmoA
MYMRFVRLKLDEDKLWLARRFYEDRALRVLGDTPGCLFAGLLQSSIHGDEIVSMTVWDGAESAAEYERSGLFDRLLDESDESMQEAGDGRADIPDPDGLVVFSGVEPDVESGTVAAGSDDRILSDAASGRIFVRLVAVRLRPGAEQEFEERYQREVRATLAEMPGCLDSFLVVGSGDSGRMLSVTLWEREEDAVRYGLSGEFERLTDRLEDLFSDLYQWNLGAADETAGGRGASRREPDVDGYHLVVGRRLR